MDDRSVIESSKENVKKVSKFDREESDGEDNSENTTIIDELVASQKKDGSECEDLANEQGETADVRSRRIDDTDKEPGVSEGHRTKFDLTKSVCQSLPLVDRHNFYRKKRRKRKQTRPRSICETETSDHEDIHVIIPTKHYKLTDTCDENNEDEDIESNDGQTDLEGTSLGIKQKPLCSKLCIRKERKVQKSTIRKEPSITSKEITEIINATNENTNSPCTTNRYRRHFLKQLRKAEAKRLKEVAKSEIADTAVSDLATSLKPYNTEDANKDDRSESDVQVLDISNEDVDSDDDYSLDGKKIKIDKVSHGDQIECNVCQKKFTDAGTFMAHYICHSSFEKEHAGRMSISMDKEEESHREGQESQEGSEGSQKGSEVKVKDKETTSTSPDLLGDSTYFCQVCNQRFNNITSLQSHMSCHSGDEDGGSDGKSRDFYCHLCHKKFASAGSLHVHNKIHTGDNPYTCLKCKKSFRDKTRLTTHIRVHTGEKPFTCSYCYKSFSQKGNLKLHQKIHTGERDCVCKVCGSSFRLKSDLVRHMKVHTGVDHCSSDISLELSADEKQASYSSSDEMMEKSIRDSVSWISAHGAKTVLDPSDTGAREADVIGQDVPVPGLNLVKRVPEKVEKDLDRLPPELTGFKPEEKNLMLSIDSEVEFIKAMTLAKMRSNEENSVQTIPCPLCGIVLTSVDNLNHHVLLHHNPLNTFSSPIPATDLVLFGLDRPPVAAIGSKKYYRCKECAVDFSSFPEFQLHLKSHTPFSGQMKIRDAKCSICNAMVAPDDMADHLSSHTGEKTYSCAICAKVFRRSHHLQTHLRTHTGDRPYICADCGKCFVRGDHLQNHRRTHTGEKPYSCDVCSKSYSQSHHLLRHKRTHTGERPYCCVLCDKTFSRDHHLKKHMEVHNCVVFPEKPEDSARRSPSSPIPSPKPTPPSSTASMVTRSSNRIAQMMSSLATDHSASRLMESMVKKHLLEQEKTTPFLLLDDHHTTDNKPSDGKDVNIGSSVSDTRPSAKDTSTGSIGTEKRALKITDILDEHIPIGPKMSEKLVVDHVIRATHGVLGRDISIKSKAHDGQDKSRGKVFGKVKEKDKCSLGKKHDTVDDFRRHVRTRSKVSIFGKKQDNRNDMMSGKKKEDGSASVLEKKQIIDQDVLLNKRKDTNKDNSFGKRVDSYIDSVFGKITDTSEDKISAFGKRTGTSEGKITDSVFGKRDDTLEDEIRSSIFGKRTDTSEDKIRSSLFGKRTDTSEDKIIVFGKRTDTSKDKIISEDNIRSSLFGKRTDTSEDKISVFGKRTDTCKDKIISEDKIRSSLFGKRTDTSKDKIMSEDKIISEDKIRSSLFGKRTDTSEDKIRSSLIGKRTDTSKDKVISEDKIRSSLFGKRTDTSEDKIKSNLFGQRNYTDDSGVNYVKTDRDSCKTRSKSGGVGATEREGNIREENEDRVRVEMTEFGKSAAGRMLTLEDIVNQRLRVEYNL